MRIVGGEFRGRRLAAPHSDAIRPTSDRVRGAIFDILRHGIDGFEIGGARVVDLFAGTGALGLEALSRGARFALFVDMSAQARALIRRNIEALALTGRTRVWRRDATRLGSLEALAPFDLLFADPPYGKGLGEASLIAAIAGCWLAPGAICVVEEAANAPFSLPEGLERIHERRYGDTATRFLRYRA